MQTDSGSKLAPFDSHRYDMCLRNMQSSDGQHELDEHTTLSQIHLIKRDEYTKKFDALQVSVPLALTYQ